MHSMRVPRQIGQRQNIQRQNLTRDKKFGDKKSRDNVQRQCTETMSEDITSKGQKIRRDKTFGGTKHSEGQNVRTDKKAEDKHPEGQND